MPAIGCLLALILPVAGGLLGGFLHSPEVGYIGAGIGLVVAVIISAVMFVAMRRASRDE